MNQKVTEEVERNEIERADVLAQLIGIVAGQMGVVTSSVPIRNEGDHNRVVGHTTNLNMESGRYAYRVAITVNRVRTPE